MGFGYTNHNNPFQIELLDVGDASVFDIFTQQQEQGCGGIDATRDFGGMERNSRPFWVRRQEQPLAAMVGVEFERDADW